MKPTQHDLMLKAFGCLLRKQMNPATKTVVAPEKIGTIRHLNRSESALPPAAREAFNRGDFTNQADLQTLLPYLKPVSVFLQAHAPQGKTWPKTGGKKEAARAQKRLANDS